MDERLEKALEFSNYTLTLNNQKRNIKNRVAQLQLVHHQAGVFIADNLNTHRCLCQGLREPLLCSPGCKTYLIRL